MLRAVVIAPDPLLEIPVVPDEEGWRLGMTVVRQEFPTLLVEVLDRRLLTQPHLRVRAWRTLSFEPGAVDAEVIQSAALTPTRLQLGGTRTGETARALLEILTRFQCLVRRRNPASELRSFDRVLLQLREMHDTSRPHLFAAYLHALDTWQWVLRLLPNASLELQLAALFHEIAVLVPGYDPLEEHDATNVGALGQARARTASELIRGGGASLGVDAATCERVSALIVEHEGPDTEDGAVLSDADALSFMSRQSASYLDLFGEAQLGRKMDYLLRRLRRTSRCRLTHIRFRADVERLVVETLLSLQRQPEAWSPEIDIEAERRHRPPKNRPTFAAARPPPLPPQSAMTRAS